MDGWLGYSPDAANTGANSSVGFGDVIKEAGASAAGLGAQVSGTAQYAMDQAAGADAPQSSGSLIAQGVNKLFGAAQDYLENSESAAAKDAKVNPGNHPLGYAGLTAAGILPAVAVFSLAPEGVIGPALAGGGMQIGQVVGDAQTKTNNLSDDELAQESPIFKKMLDTGMDPQTARTQLMSLQVTGGQILGSLAAGAAGGAAVGPMMRGAGALEGGVIKRTLGGAAEGGLGMGAMSQNADWNAQQSDIAMKGSGETDWTRNANAALSGALTGAVIGGGVNGLFGHGPQKGMEVVDPVSPGADAAAALNASLNPDAGKAQEPALVAPQVSDPAQAAPTAPTGPIVPGRAPQAVPDTAPEASPVTPTGNIPVDDSATVVPEGQDTLQAQRQKLIDGQKPAMLFPVGQSPSSVGMGSPPPGMERLYVPKVGTVHFDPQQVTKEQILAAGKNGTMNEVLGLGSVSKTDAMADAAAGHTPVGIVERQPDGTEVTAAVGTDKTADQQAAELEANKAPGNTVGIEPVDKAPMERPTSVDSNADPAADAPDMVAQQASDTQPTAGDEALIKGQPAEGSAPDVISAGNAPDIGPKAQEVLAKKGSRKNPVKVEKKSDMAVGRDIPPEQPSAAQIDANNYARLHRTFDTGSGKGLQVAIETPKGGTRTDKNGQWKVENFPADYGYFKGTKGADGDGVDLFHGDNTKSNRVFIIDQRDPGTGKFDEHKVMVGFSSPEEATAAYDKAFSDGSGPSRRGAMTETTITGMNDWLKNGDTTKPFTQRDMSDEQRRQSMAGDMASRGSTKKWEKSELDNFVKAEDIFEKHAPTDNRIPTSAADREAFQARLQAMMDDVKEQGVTVNQRVSDAATPKGMLGLREAQKMLMDLKSGNKVGLARIQEFIAREWLTRHGETDMVKENRREAGDIANRRAPTIEDAEKGLDQEEVTHAGNEDAGRTHLTADERLGEEPVKPLEQDAGEQGLDVQELDGHDAIGADSPDDTYEAANSGNVGLTRFKGKDIVRTTTLGELNIPVNRMVMKNEFLKQIATRLIDHVKTTASDVPVAIVKDGLMGEDGRYDPHDHTVYIPERNANDAHALLHEGIHAVLSRGIDANPMLRGQIRKLMDFAKDQVNDREGAEYGFTDEHEFLAEALSNPQFQSILATIKTPMDMIPESRPGTIWDKLRSVMSAVLSKVTGAPKAGVESVLETVFRHADEAQQWTDMVNKSEADADASSTGYALIKNPQGTVTSQVTSPAKDIGAMAKGLIDKLPTSAARRGLNKLLTNDQMRQSYERLWNGPVMRTLNDLLERCDVRTNEIKEAGDKLSRELIGASRQFETDWPKFEQLLQDVRMYEAHPDVALSDPKNAHLDDFSQGAAKHAELSAAYDALPEELKSLYGKTVGFFKDAHDAFAHQMLGELMDAKDFEDVSPSYDVKGLQDRIHNDALTDQDRADLIKAYGEAKGKALAEEETLKSSKGPYTPLSRRGDYVVQAEHDFVTPEGNRGEVRRLKGSKEDPMGRTFEFTDKDDLTDWLKSTDARANVREVAYDPDSGELLSKQSKERQEEVVKDPRGPDMRWQATVNAKHVEFHETQHAAEEARAALDTNKEFKNVQDMQRRSGSNGVDLELSSAQVQTLARELQKSGLSSAAKEAAVRSMTEASIAMQRGNRAMKNQIRAEKTSGASLDIIRSVSDYNSANARARARMEFEKPTSEALTEMRRQVRGPQDGKGMVRSEVLNEMEGRVFGNYAPDPKTPYSQFMNHAMTISFLKRMASPAHLLLHMTHPWMISAPVMAARHGAAKTAINLVRAYKDMGAGGGLAEGFRGAARIAKDVSADPVNFIDYFKNNLAGVSDHEGIGKMLDELAATNRIHPEAGMEVQRMAPGRNRYMQGVDRVDGAFRQLTQATESINRVAEAIAAYRMELQKTGNHDAAVRYAGDTLANTQGLYSRSNMAPIFRNPALKPFMQFKQFPQMIYHLLGRSLYNAFKGETPETRAEAAKQFAGVIATHVAMAGALGLPMEVIKAPLMLANALGVTSKNWDDYERDAYMKVSKQFGPQAAEIMMHGLSRAMGPFSVDVHHRLGLNSLFFFGEPESNKPQDTMNYLLNFVGGAPASLAMDTMSGVQNLMKGNFEKGAEQILPIKAFTDVAKGVRYYVSGKPTGRGLPDMGPMSAPQAAVQALGFTPADVAQHQEARQAAFRVQQQTKQDKQSLIDNWANTSDKAGVFKQIQAYNKEAEHGQQITPAMLSHAAAARGTGNKAILGITPTNSNRADLEDISKAYNTR